MRVKQIQLNMDRLRWLPNNLGSVLNGKIFQATLLVIVVSRQQVDLVHARYRRR